MAADQPIWLWSEPHGDRYYVTWDQDDNAQYHWAKQVTWIESEQHGDSYYVTYDKAGKIQYHWKRQVKNGPDTPKTKPRRPATSTNHSSQHRPQDSGVGHEVTPAATDVAEMPEPLPDRVRERIPNLMPGTPSRGWYDLDKDYRMRTNHEAREFFVQGRVFSMLWAESASETIARSGTVNTAITMGRFGEKVYSQIRRFIIVKVKRGFVYVVGIFTYGDRGTLKPGCIPEEHAAVYFTGSAPLYLQGEREAGLVKEAIEIEPENPNEYMKPASRVRFGKHYPVEWNVKVKNIGKVAAKDMSKLISYWKVQEHADEEAGDGMEGNPQHPGSLRARRPSHASQPYGGQESFHTTPRPGFSEPQYQYQQQSAEYGADSESNSQYSLGSQSASSPTQPSIPRSSHLNQYAPNHGHGMSQNPASPHRPASNQHAEYFPQSGHPGQYSGFGQQQQYPEYNPQYGYNQQGGYDQQQEFGQPAAFSHHGQQSGYGHPSGHGQQPSYGQYNGPQQHDYAYRGNHGPYHPPYQ